MFRIIFKELTISVHLVPSPTQPRQTGRQLLSLDEKDNEDNIMNSEYQYALSFLPNTIRDVHNSPAQIRLNEENNKKVFIG